MSCTTENSFKICCFPMQQEVGLTLFHFNYSISIQRIPFQIGIFNAFQCNTYIDLHSTKIHYYSIYSMNSLRFEHRCLSFLRICNWMNNIVNMIKPHLLNTYFRNFETAWNLRRNSELKIFQWKTCPTYQNIFITSKFCFFIQNKLFSNFNAIIQFL